MHQSLRARRELCSERGCFHPRRPENGLGLQRIGRAAAVDRNPALLDVGHLHARQDGDSEIGKGLRRSGREPRGIGQEQPVGGLEEENARASGIDGAEIESESLSRELADGPRELDPGRTSSHDDEREKRLPFRQIFLALRPLERVENPGAYSRRILDRLEPRGPSSPVLASEVMVRGARREDEVIVRQTLAVHRKLSPIEVQIAHLRLQDADVLLSREDRPKRRGDVRGREPARRDLIEERLEQVEVAPIDQGDLNRRPEKPLRGVQTSESAADDDDLGRRQASAFAVELLEKDGLVLEHDGDRLANGVEVLPVLAEDPSVDLLFHRLSPAVFDRSRLDRRIHAIDDLALDESDRLFGLGTAENLEKLRVDYGGHDGYASTGEYASETGSPPASLVSAARRHRSEITSEPVEGCFDPLRPRRHVPASEEHVALVRLRSSEEAKQRLLQNLQREPEVLPAVQHQGRCRHSRREVQRVHLGGVREIVEAARQEDARPEPFLQRGEDGTDSSAQAEAVVSEFFGIRIIARLQEIDGTSEILVPLDHEIPLRARPARGSRRETPLEGSLVNRKQNGSSASNNEAKVRWVHVLGLGKQKSPRAREKDYRLIRRRSVRRQVEIGDDALSSVSGVEGDSLFPPVGRAALERLGCGGELGAGVSIDALNDPERSVINRLFPRVVTQDRFDGSGELFG